MALKMDTSGYEELGFQSDKTLCSGLFLHQKADNAARGLRWTRKFSRYSYLIRVRVELEIYIDSIRVILQLGSQMFKPLLYHRKWDLFSMPAAAADIV